MIKASQLRAKMIELGERLPDASRECRYVNPETREPCCIVGTALVELGVPARKFYDDEDLNSGTSARTMFRHMADELGLENDLTYDEWAAIDDAQCAQDTGVVWGEAIEHLR